jgi:hypothetical protein
MTVKEARERRRFSKQLQALLYQERRELVNIINALCDHDRASAIVIDKGFWRKDCSIGHLLIGKQSGYCYAVRDDSHLLDELVEVHYHWKRVYGGYYKQQLTQG